MEGERALRWGRREDSAVEGLKVIEKEDFDLFLSHGMYLKVIEKEDQSTRGERGREGWREGARRMGMEPWERQCHRLCSEKYKDKYKYKYN